MTDDNILFCQWPKNYLNRLPKSAEEDIKSALEYAHGEYSILDIVKELVDGTRQIWLLTKGDEFIGTVLTRICEYNTKRVCEVTHAGGKEILKHVKLLDKRITDWAKMNNCSDLTVVGREGWHRATRSLGFEKRYLIIGKEIS